MDTLKRKPMTEDQIKQLGFELAKEYDYDQYHTRRYKLGPMLIEFTYEGEDLASVDLTTEEVIAEEITFDELKTVAPIMAKWPQN